MLYCTELYCTVLYWIVLYCTVLNCTVLYCTVLHFTVLHYTKLFINFRSYFFYFPSLELCNFTVFLFLFVRYLRNITYKISNLIDQYLLPIQQSKLLTGEKSDIKLLIVVNHSTKFNFFCHDLWRVFFFFMCEFLCVLKWTFLLQSTPLQRMEIF